MADIVSPEKRSQMMAGIRGKNTKPELQIRSGLHRSGFRYKLHVKDLPGKPDLVFPKYGAVIQAHGCFWHGHDCHLFKLPSTRQDFWNSKINRNKEVDDRNNKALLEKNWRICIVWECALRGRSKLPYQIIINRCIQFLQSEDPFLEIRGTT